MSDEQFTTDGQRDDVLGERLRAEAMAERPVVSGQLHRQILARTGAEAFRSGSQRHSRLSFLLPRFAAAMFVVAMAAFWMMHGHRHSVSNLPGVVVDQFGPVTEEVSQTPDANVAVLDSIAFNFGDVVAGRIWPPEIQVNVPLAGGLASSEVLEKDESPVAEPQGSADWLLETLDAPGASAKMALTDLVPPNIRMMADWVGFDYRQVRGGG